MNTDLILLVLAALCFVGDAIKLKSNISLVGAGLLFWVLSLIF
jgi:hypothetical protein